MIDRGRRQGRLRPLAGDPQQLHRPIWDYTFPRPIRLEARRPGDGQGDRPRHWSDSTVVVLNSQQGDPLAIRMLSGTIKPTKGGTTTLVFASDFKMPELPRPGE